MKVVVEDAPGRLVRAPVPEFVVRALSAMVEGGASMIGDTTVTLELRNTLAMQSAVHFDGRRDEARIILDWAQFERLPAVLRFIDPDRPLTRQGDRLLTVFARELRLYWQRKLVSARAGDITDEERAYQGGKRGRGESMPEEVVEPYLSPEITTAMRYANYAFGHELGHVLAYKEPDLPLSLYARFEEDHPRLIKPSPSLAEELFCDHSALCMVADFSLQASLSELNTELALILALGQLQSEVHAAAPRIRMSLQQRDDEAPRRMANFDRERKLVTEWGFRMHLAALTIAELMKAAGHSEAETAAAKEERDHTFHMAEKILQEDYMGWLN